jgi:hypothetical protein
MADPETPTATSDRSISLSTPKAGNKTIFGFMAFAVIFSVVGAEIKRVEKAQASALTEPVTIFLGGTVAAAILTLLSDTGDTGREVAVGIAGLALVTAALVNGKPVWDALNHLLGSTPTTPSGQTTAGQGTTPTAPTVQAGVTTSNNITTGATT